MTSKPQALINDIISYIEVLRNVYGITPEFMWNNINPTHRFYINDDSIKRCDGCDDWEHFEPDNISYPSINVGKESKFIDGCCDCSGSLSDDEDEEEEEAKDIQFNQAYD